ncbi:GMC family oxidoreductase [Mesorhizobium sp. ASY16-5R]|uniref:GMC family oxidoreductase n=1 Tax=Mesorhizobium sp. ASY16-5R TaxID=3445772 RepID=UPI003FA02F54
MKRHFDVAVIGAGSAGSVVASRLSEDTACRVVLIEAGGWPADPNIADPSKWPALQNRDYDWAYRTVPQPFTAGRVHEWPRGRIVGGSSCLHAMAHVRGHPDDFDAWAEAGGPGWSFKALLPAFIRSETFRAFRNASHGTDGPLSVHLPDDEVSPLVRDFMAAGETLGVPRLTDHNSGPLSGVSPNSLTIDKGRRVSVADAYLSADVLARPNLTVLTDCQVDHLQLEGMRAARLACVVNGEEIKIEADRFVLCAGAIGSPMLLMRSGIGPRAALKEAGIECRIDRPEIGSNLQDHLLGLGNVYSAKRPVPPSRLQHSESLMYLNSDDHSSNDGSPDIVVACVVAPSAAPGLEAPPYGSAYTLLFGVTHPLSRGRLLPRSGDRHLPPIIDPRYLEAEADRATFRKAFDAARAIGHHPALAAWRAEEVLPGPATRTPAEIDSFIATAASTHHHPCGTCRMGSDPSSVVDPDLTLRGLDNLSVVDASIIPRIPSGPINAAVVAIAEHWCRQFEG